MTRLAVLRDVAAAAPTSQATWQATWQAIDAAAKKRAIRLMPALDVQGPDQLDAAFAAAVKEHVDGLLVGSTPLFGAWRQQIVALAAKNRLAAVYDRSHDTALAERWNTLRRTLHYGREVGGLDTRPEFWVGVVGTVVDKIACVFLAFIAYKALSREARRYREVVAGRPGAYRE